MGDKTQQKRISFGSVGAVKHEPDPRKDSKIPCKIILNGGFGPKSTKDNRGFHFSFGIVSVLPERFRIGRRIFKKKMFLVIFLCFFVIDHASGDFLQVTLPVYTPPSHEVMLNSYFQKSDGTDGNRTKKSILSVSDKFYQTIEVMKKELSANISDLEKELSERNVSDEGISGNISEIMQDYIRSGIFKNLLSGPVEATTYRYPTAVWSSHNYEKLKNSQRFRPRNGTRVHVSRSFLHPAYVPLDRGFHFGGPERRNRGKTKWKDVASSELANSEPVVTTNQESEKGFKVDKNEFVDRFLEQSLMKYLISSNLRENVGNVSVKTFSDILKNITEQKPKRPQSPYDENKELRMKFLEEVILKKRNETKASHGKFLEKQLQRRLEKVQDVFNEKDKEKILANMWKYTPLNRTMDSPEEKKTKTKNVTEEVFANITSTVETITETSATTLSNVSLVYLTTATPEFRFKQSTGSGNIRGTAKFNRTRYEVTEVYREFDYESQDENGERGNNKNLLKLTAEETSYYRKGSFPSLTFIGQPEKPGVIPGRPFVDYPVHSFPPATKFKCPKFKGGKPIMMADPETRCQVFYICTGDGPTTAMLCPNGTMFNENFLVCDWWYNVKC